MTNIILKSLFFHISKKRKIQFLFLLVISLIVSIIEMLSIVSILPFIRAVTNENFFEERSLIYHFFSTNNREDTIIITGIVFGSLIFINSSLRCILIYIGARLANYVTAELSIKIYKSSLFDSYSRQIEKKTSNLISAITQKVYQTYFTISSIINMLSAGCILVGLISVLIWINPKITFFCFFFLSIFYLIIFWFGKKILKKNSQIINAEQDKIVYNLQNGLGAFRDIILDKSQQFFINDFTNASLAKAKRQSVNEIIQQSPRYLLEAIGIIIMVILIIFWNNFLDNSSSIIYVFPTLAALIMGSQKILPLINILYLNFSIYKGNVYQVLEITNVLNNFSKNEKLNNLVKKKKINFTNRIFFSKVSFFYKDRTKTLLENVNFEIKKGSKIGIFGKSGEGKSTILDLLMGFLEPRSGSIYIDQIKLSPTTIDSWQSKISHVPQKLFISDGSFLQNIALAKSANDIDFKKVQLVSKKAKIHDFIINLKRGYNEEVGERGVKLSGGQIQRVGLARSLYKNAEIIIFDEATNSLDIDTEKMIMNELYNLDNNLTIIIVAHRLNTLNQCDVIFELKNKKIIKIK
jgi:ABC-type multidrug transport system fused ATPase/permease subunit